MARRLNLFNAGERFVDVYSYYFDEPVTEAALTEEIHPSQTSIFSGACPDWTICMGRTMKTITIYGIKACDTMKKARDWLDRKGVSYDYHDYKTQGIDRAHLEKWAKDVGWETLLNRAGTTFRKLPDADKANIDAQKAIALMLAQPSMIKRPVVEHGGRIIVGFKPEIYEKALG